MVRWPLLWRYRQNHQEPSIEAKWVWTWEETMPRSWKPTQDTWLFRRNRMKPGSVTTGSELTCRKSEAPCCASVSLRDTVTCSHMPRGLPRTSGILMAGARAWHLACLTSLHPAKDIWIHQPLLLSVKGTNRTKPQEHLWTLYCPKGDVLTQVQCCGLDCMKYMWPSQE